MNKETKALELLNQLIARLEANTGGEQLLPEEKKEGVKSVKKEMKVEHAKQVKEEQKVQKNKKQKKEEHKKKKEEGGKQSKKKEDDSKVLPEGADPDLLIFAGVDMRVSDMIEAWKHPDSDKLFCEKIMVGKQLRFIASGLQGHAKLQEMKGKVIVMANLKPRSLGGFDSNGMVICSSDKDNTTFQILRPEGYVGERLYLDGHEYLFEQTEEVIPVMKKKNLQRFLPLFKTDQQGFVTWKGIKVRTKAGCIKSTLKQGNVS